MGVWLISNWIEIDNFQEFDLFFAQISIIKIHGFYFIFFILYLLPRGDSSRRKLHHVVSS